MNLLETIVVPQMTTGEEEILIKDKGQRIALYDTHVHLMSEGVWKIKDETLNIMVEKDFCNEKWFSKAFVGDIDLYFQTTVEKWIVDFAGFKFVFYTKKEAKELAIKIVDWRWG